jgi:ABC-2 type transport system permease protein
VALLALWIFGSFFISRTSGVLAKLLHPTPSAFAFSRSVQQDNELGLDRKTPARERQKRFEDSLLSRYGVATLASLPLNIRGLNLQRGEEYGYRIFEKNYGGLEATYRSQDRVITWMNVLSPSQSMRSISTGLCATGIDRHIHFAAQAEAHRRLIAQTMNDDIAQNSGSSENYQNDDDLWEQIPPFRYREASLAEAAKPHLPAMLSLVVWCAVLLACLAQRAGTLRRL